MVYLQKIKNDIEIGMIDSNGCSKEEITNLENLCGCCFPKSYVEFLSLGGKDISFLRSDFCFYNHIPTLNQSANVVLNENNSTLMLRENDFVFWMHLDLIFTFFNLSEGDDPPVYFYRGEVEQKSFLKITDSLSDFFIKRKNSDVTLFKPCRV